MKRIDGIYARIKITLQKPENKRRAFSGTFILAILAIIFLFAPSVKVQSDDLSTESVIPLANSPLAGKELPDFSLDKILEIKGNDLSTVAVKIKNGEMDELWWYNLKNQKQENISFNTSVSADFPIGLKNNYIFWLSKDRNLISAFDCEKRVIFQKQAPFFSPGQDGRTRVKFSEISWEIIVGAADFYFFSGEAGEVFSDGNSEVLESFRQKYNLDNFLNQEELANLGFSVGEAQE